MEKKQNFLCIVMAVFTAIIFCLPVPSLMAGGTGPGVGAQYKAIGPQVKGSLIIGWKPDSNSTTGGGIVEAHLMVEGKIYAAVIRNEYQEEDFLNPNPSYPTVEESWKQEIISWDLPLKIAEDYGMVNVALVKILAVKDITNWGIAAPLVAAEDIGIDYPPTYKDVVACDVKISFFEYVKKP